MDEIIKKLFPEKFVSLGGSLSRTTLLLAFTIGYKESSVSRPVTWSYTNVHNTMYL